MTPIGLFIVAAWIFIFGVIVVALWAWFSKRNMEKKFDETLRRKTHQSTHEY